MDVRARLDADMKQALKNKQKIRLSTIRMVRTAIKNAEIDRQKTLTEDEVLAILNRELKQRRDSLQAFESAGRMDLVDNVKQEIDVLMEYLPQPLTEDELRQLIQEAIQETGAASVKDMGKVMPVLMPKVKGRADGKVVNQLVREYLQH